VASHPRPSRSQPRCAHPRKSRPLFAAALAVTAVCAVSLVGAPPAAAEPTVAAIEKQIDVAWNKLEPVIEQHNLTRTQLAARKKSAAQLAKRIEPLQLQVDIAMTRVGEFAALQYKGGKVSAINALVTGGSPTELTRQLQILDQFARRQQAEIRNVVELKQRYAEQKKPLDALVADLAKTEAQLAVRAKQIDAEIKKLEQLRRAAYGSGAGTGSLRPVACPATYPGGAAGKAIRFACAQIGKPYSWGADGPGSYDCSGLTQRSWAQGNVGLPHNARAQRNATKRVSRSQLRAGDLVFFYGDLHHVGMYAGRVNGTDWIVHASRSGVPVQMRRMDDGNINSYGRPS
jgi:cell wall-associated NlpC family hydrolase